MSDPDREKVVVEETPRVERETTVVTSGDGGGGGGAIVAVLVVLVVAVLLFLYFGGFLGGREKTELNVNVDVPKVEAPDIDVNLPPPSQPSDSNTNKQ